MGRTFSNLLFHIVFSTKHRLPLILPEFQNKLQQYIGGIIKGEDGIMLAIVGMPDHIHILLKLKPIHSMSQMMKKIKGNSSKWMKEQQKLSVRFSWQDGYGAFSVSESQVEVVKRYINNQERHHQKSSFKEEFTEILKRHQTSGEIALEKIGNRA